MYPLGLTIGLETPRHENELRRLLSPALLQVGCPGVQHVQGLPASQFWRVKLGVCVLGEGRAVSDLRSREQMITAPPCPSPPPYPHILVAFERGCGEQKIPISTGTTFCSCRISFHWGITSLLKLPQASWPQPSHSCKGSLQVGSGYWGTSAAGTAVPTGRGRGTGLLGR